MDEAWEVWTGSAWSLAEARDGLDQILDLAARQQPQRIRRGEREVVVLDADAYYALAEAADQALPPPPVQRDVCTCSGRTLLGALRASPWRDALEGGDWPWSWNWVTREWDQLGPVPLDKPAPDADAPGERSLFEIMRNSPLAVAIREAGISDEEVDELFRIRG